MTRHPQSVKNKALEYRKSGMTYGDIGAKLKIPAVTVAYWIRNQTEFVLKPRKGAAVTIKPSPETNHLSAMFNELGDSLLGLGRLFKDQAKR